MGAMLSITGIFGMAAYSVSRRLRELGIRIALGAQRKEVLQAALGRALKLLALGSPAGLILGILATRVLASIVYQATPAILSSSPESSSPWPCSASSPHGSPHSARCRSIPSSFCAKNEVRFP